MDVSNPKRILTVSTPDADVLKILEELTSSAPSPIDDSISGLTHSWTLKTQYYTASLSIWIDDISDVATWLREFSKEEAKEVVDAVGAWIYVFRKPVTDEDLATIKRTVEAIKSVIHKACGEYWEGTCLAVGTKQSTTTSLQLSGDEWDDFCRDHGFEYVDAEAKGSNEFGEQLGLARLREALETTDWEGEVKLDADDFEDIDNFGDGADWDGFADEQAEMNLELLGMKTALYGGKFEDGNEEEVEEMGKMMNKLMAIRDTTSAMPESERKKFAAKAVKDFMKDT
ncbi:uncharacterized protein PV09_05130 [Verruconis gallopava]|uniref:Increased recombination centers protein 6 n=1 Tax=Verruconis gallopava TaxID=253628 RepID=A0A0D1XMP6_9PEZI|nr:uncharacterized protein PV09_05130 [Verruconis gallopava]KIW03831.1 hypothetical protein PV09_05130 [Verruconis gallopava]